jgi:hypothetical protein
MFLTKKKPTAVSATIEDEETDPIYDEELETIEYLRSLDKKDYDKIIKKAEIYREADEAVAKLDGKKAAKKAQELLENEYTE